MTPDRDEMLDRLARLPGAMPDADRAQRTRARAHERLAERRRTRERPDVARADALELTVVGAISVAYLFGVLSAAWQMLLPR